MEDKYTGQTVQEKFKAVAEKMDTTDMMLISTLDDIAWFLNLRGDDIQFNPLFFSYLIFHKEGKADLFIEKSQVSDVEKYLADNNITVHPYESV